MSQALMSAISQQTDNSVLNRIFSDLRSKSPDVRERAAKDLHDHLAITSREYSTELFGRYVNDINKRIFELIHSADSCDRLGGIAAIDHLIYFDGGEENTTKITRFANYLRIVIPSNDVECMRAAANALGRLAIPGGTLTADFVEFEVKRALEWLQSDRQESRRHAAVLIIRALAENSPTLLYTYVPQILDLIWVALRDPKVQIRNDAAEALRSCLEIIYQRDNTLRQQWFTTILEEAKNGLRIGTPDAIHASLLTYKELMLKGGMFMQTRYSDVCEVMLKLKDHRDSLVRRTVLSMIPILASYNPSEFTAHYLHTFMLHLLYLLRKERDRNLVLKSIGQVAFAVRSNMGPYLDAILVNIKEGLSAKGRARREQEPAIFECISMLATAVGQALTKHMHREILDLIFQCGLSEPLHQTLIDLAHYIPPLLPTIQDRLLDILSLTLSGRHFHPPGSPSASLPMVPSMAKEYREQMLAKDGPGNEMTDTQLVILALNILGNFDFKGHVLNEFVRNCAISYIEDDNPELRETAALTCCHLYLNDPICFQTSAHAIHAVSEVLDKLLSVAIGDPVPEIRLKILRSLDSKFDPHLSQADNVRLLFMALNDESFPVREAAMVIVGRLTLINPAYVMPSLRKALIKLLTELEYSNITRTKEESTRLLAILISSTRMLTKPYVKPMMKVLLPRARDNSPGVSASIITALGELSKVAGEDMKPYLPDLMPLILETFQDQSSPIKRDAALRALGQIASNSGYVIDPLLDYPQLLGLLVSILKGEQALPIRRETVRLIGILGALDPYKYQMIERKTEDPLSEQNATSTDISLIMAGMSPSSDEYLPTVVINTLMSILRDPSLGAHHTAVIQAIMYIFKTLGLKCVPFLPQIIPGFISVIRGCSVNMMLEFYFQQLSILVTIVKQHIRNFLEDIFAIIKDFFNQSSSLQITILGLIESVARSLEGEFKIHVPVLLPLMLSVCEKDRTPNQQPTMKVLHTFVVLGSNLEEYLHLILPAILRMFEHGSKNLRKCAIQTVGRLCQTINVTDMASRIVHPLLRMFSNPDEELRAAAMETLCSLIFQLGPDYTVFIPVTSKCLLANKIQSQTYDIIVSKLVHGEPLPQHLNPVSKFNDRGPDEVSAAEPPVKKLPVNQEHLKHAWEASQRSTRDDWQEWVRRLSVEFLKESPSHALRACAGLAGVYFPLAKDLFNASFVSCWSELYDSYQEELVRSIETALMSVNIPPEILQTLLNLAEFMEHDDKALPIDIRTLGHYAQRCHTFAKALHYKELEFYQEPTTSTIEALIAINNQLQQSDAAVGILKHAQQHHDLQLKETWYEKLQRWDDALEAYNRREKDEPQSLEVTMGKMRCLHALGEWELLSQLAQEKWTNSTNETKRTVAPLAAAAAWGLGQWERMDIYIGVMKPESPDRAFFNAILSLHRNHFDDAELHILKARDLLVTELTALVSESYNRAYSVVVRVQMLAELEEIIAYKRAVPDSEPQRIMRKTWVKRLCGCQRNVDIWQRMLKVRALVVKPKLDMDMWIKFANLCRKSGRFGLAEKSLNLLVDEGSLGHADSRAPPQVVYAYLKFLWSTGSQKEALGQLKDFAANMSKDLGVNPLEAVHSPDITLLTNGNQTNNVNGNTVAPPSNGAVMTANGTIATNKENKADEYTKLLARCFVKQGEWQVALQNSWKAEDAQPILTSYLLATRFDKDWYKAWHNWALANFEVVSALNRHDSHEGPPPEIVHLYVVPAIKGFFRSIALSSSNSIQDTLRLLTLWFRYGGYSEPAQAISDGFSNVSIDTWLEVIPQLFSRIHQRNPVVRKLLQGLLIELGKAHPQALVYPLTVAIKSDSVSRQIAALAIMNSMRTHSPKLVEQAELVSQELIRVAVLWHEQWHEGLENASRLFSGDHNIEKMFTVLEPLHKMLERGPETLREVSFHTAFGRDLHDAYEWVLSFKRTRDMAHLNQAWDIYYNVFRRITRQLPQLQSLDLQYVSPKLLACHDLELAVPGTYISGKPIIRIIKFEPIFTVISSKQRPRRLCIKGSDGKDYQFVLKGHEDIRQDGLVMQLFGLVNTLLAVDSECFKRHLNIQSYPAIPLSPKSGLLGWVPDSDTFHVLIREYRDSRKILLNIEHRIMLQMAPDYDSLTLMQKVEVFMYALDNTTGQDLYRVLWLKSRSSEAWLDRRTTYTRSLAVMSMVGYILGLGDRHPSNLMLDRYTGKVVHIDFGDCFEAAILREKFPEKVPFRLTRMLTYAMEVSGIEGSFRITCEHVMRVLRDNKESLMAILEAFAHDPLINWGFDIPTQALLASNIDVDDEYNSNNNANTTTNENKMEEGLEKAAAMGDDLGALDDEGTEADEDGSVSVEERNKAIHRNARAAMVLKRITDKLTGNDFRRARDLSVPDQVDKLIEQATSVENLCQHFIGWCSFW